MLSAGLMDNETATALMVFRETHGGTLSGMTRYTDHLCVSIVLVSGSGINRMERRRGKAFAKRLFPISFSFLACTCGLSACVCTFVPCLVLCLAGLAGTTCQRLVTRARASPTIVSSSSSFCSMGTPPTIKAAVVSFRTSSSHSTKTLRTQAGGRAWGRSRRLFAHPARRLLRQ